MWSEWKWLSRTAATRPWGIRMRASEREEDEVLVVPCDLSAVDTARTHWPFLRDRRIDAYQDLTRRYRD